MNNLTEREVNTILAALHCWKIMSEDSNYVTTLSFDQEMRIATDNVQYNALENDEIDNLIKKITTS